MRSSSASAGLDDLFEAFAEWRFAKARSADAGRKGGESFGDGIGDGRMKRTGEYDREGHVEFDPEEYSGLSIVFGIDRGGLGA